jgi:acetyl-CoA acetyltransferase
MTRAECDAYTVQSQQGYSAALDTGRLGRRVGPFQNYHPAKGVVETDFLTDAYHKPDTQLEKIAKLQPVFQKDGTGLVTAPWRWAFATAHA